MQTVGCLSSEPGSMGCFSASLSNGKPLDGDLVMQDSSQPLVVASALTVKITHPGQ